jgi:hypothetical protein
MSKAAGQFRAQADAPVILRNINPLNLQSDKADDNSVVGSQGDAATRGARRRRGFISCLAALRQSVW